jgi:hypothetical protein
MTETHMNMILNQHENKIIADISQAYVYGKLMNKETQQNV